MTEQSYDRQLSLLLRRQLALQQDRLMDEAKELVNTHFKGINDKSELLKNAQLKNFEGVTLASLFLSEVLKFIKKQSEKDASKKAWTFGGLNNNLESHLKRIAGRNPGQPTGNTGYKDTVVQNIKDQAARRSIPEDVVTEWLDGIREQEIQMEMTRAFVSYFVVLYRLARADWFVTEGQPAGSDEE